MHSTPGWLALRHTKRVTSPTFPMEATLSSLPRKVQKVITYAAHYLHIFQVIVAVHISVIISHSISCPTPDHSAFKWARATEQSTNCTLSSRWYRTTVRWELHPTADRLGHRSKLHAAILWCWWLYVQVSYHLAKLKIKLRSDHKLTSLTAQASLGGERSSLIKANG